MTQITIVLFIGLIISTTSLIMEIFPPLSALNKKWTCKKPKLRMGTRRFMKLSNLMTSIKKLFPILRKGPRRCKKCSNLMPHIMEKFPPLCTLNKKLICQKPKIRKRGRKCIIYSTLMLCITTMIIMSIIPLVRVDINSRSDLFAFGTLVPSTTPDFAKEHCPTSSKYYPFLSGFLRGYVFSEDMGYSTCYEVKL